MISFGQMWEIKRMHLILNQRTDSTFGKDGVTGTKITFLCETKRLNRIYKYWTSGNKIILEKEKKSGEPYGCPRFLHGRAARPKREGGGPKLSAVISLG